MLIKKLNRAGNSFLGDYCCLPVIGSHFSPCQIPSGFMFFFFNMGKFKWVYASVLLRLQVIYPQPLKSLVCPVVFPFLVIQSSCTLKKHMLALAQIFHNTILELITTMWESGCGINIKKNINLK